QVGGSSTALRRSDRQAHEEHVAITAAQAHLAAQHALVEEAERAVQSDGALIRREDRETELPQHDGPCPVDRCLHQCSAQPETACSVLDNDGYISDVCLIM